MTTLTKPSAEEVVKAIFYLRFVNVAMLGSTEPLATGGTADEIWEFIAQALRQQEEEINANIKKELDKLVPVQGNDEHNDALLRLLNKFNP